jgi:glycine/D-amino acid oxidase-like deaminating enzyme
MTYANGHVSHWMSALADGPAHDDVSLPWDEVDLAVVGAGLTGLWTAYYYQQRHPEARVVVLEASTVGYGASGRNGGWLSTLLPGNRAVYARTAPGGAESVREFQREMIRTIDEVVAVTEREGIEADVVRGGNLQVAPTRAALERLRAMRAAHLQWGYRPEDVVLLDAEQARARVNVAGTHGALFYPATVRLDPAKLVLGLADVLRARGVAVVEHTPVTSVGDHVVGTSRGTVRAQHIALCLEAYMPSVTGGRELIPVNSSMVATQPLSAKDWAKIGWDGRECLNEAAHTFVYAQRTADDRIAIGGRGTPYAFGSGLPGDGEVDSATVEHLTKRLTTMFPGVDFVVEHAWRGSIGVTRDWCATIRHDRGTGVGRAYGYAGHGVSATNLAARTLVDRFDDLDTTLTALPWNEHRTRSWEPEPIRWLGVHGMYRLFTLADRWEERRQSDRTSLLARLGTRLAGMHE